MRLVIGLCLMLCGAVLAQEPSPTDAKTQAERHAECAEAMLRERKVASARQEFEKALEFYRRGGDEAGSLRMQLRVAECHAAESEFGKALEAWRRTGDGVQVVASIENVASALVSADRAADAMPLLRESLAMMRRMNEGNTLAVADTINALAWCLERVDQADEALPLFRESLAMRRLLFKGDHAEVACALNNLAHCLCSVRDAAAALPVHMEALEMSRRLSEGDDPAVATDLNNLGLCFGELGRDQEALASCEEALSIRRRLFKGDDPSLARSLNNTGYYMNRVGRGEDALPLLQESLDMRRRLFDGDHPDIVQSMGNLAGCLLDLGRAIDASRLLEGQLAMCRRLFPGDHPTVASALDASSTCQRLLGRPADALPLVKCSLDMYRRLFDGDRPEIARTYCNLAFCLKDLGRPAEALPLYRESLAMYRRLYAGDATGTGTALNNLACCLREMARYSEALPLQEEALTMRRRLYKGDHVLVAGSLNNVAICMDHLGQTSEALQRYEESLAMRRRLFDGDHPDVAQSLHNIGFCMCDIGQSADGLKLLEESVAMSRRLASPDTHRWLSSFAGCMFRANRATEAVDMLKEAVDQIEGLRSGGGGLTEEDRALYFGRLKDFDAYERLIRILMTLGRDAEALSYVERARARSLLDALGEGRADPIEELRRQGEERRDTEALERIGTVQSALQAADAAVARLTHAFANMAPTGADTPERRQEAQKLTADLAAARRAQHDALRQRAQLIRSVFAAAQPADATALQHLAGRDGRVLAYAVSDQGSTLFVILPAGSAIRAFQLSWRDGTAVTADGLEEKVEAYAARMRAGRGEARGWFEEERAGEGGVSGSELFEALVPADVREDVLEAKIVYVVADGALNRLPFETLVVAPGTFWLEGGPPIVYGASGSALLWSRERRDQQIAEGRLEEAVVVGDPVFRPEVEPPATGILVTRVVPEGQASHLGIRAGDVILAYDGKELADFQALATARSAVDAAVQDGSRKPEGIALAMWRAGERNEIAVETGKLGVEVAQAAMPEAWRRFQQGDPALARAALERTAELSRYGELKPLPGTRREAEAIAEALKGMQVRLLLGEGATHPAVLEAAPKARYLHFATHGLADETETASYSSLALTLPRVATAEDDGFLSLEDLFSRWRGKLRMCELVVLSACETQKGKIQKDEAVQALPVGFLFAGAPTVIATLWRVDDASAAELMGDFYRRLASGKGKLEAFTEARKALRKRHPDPYHWAPYVYIGDPR